MTTYPQGSAPPTTEELEQDQLQLLPPTPTAAKSEHQNLAAVLLAPDSRAAYLRGRLCRIDAKWERLTDAGLLAIGKDYGAEVVMTALGYLQEEGATTFDAYPYLRSVCERVRAERGEA